jgi:hypothetical protein
LGVVGFLLGTVGRVVGVVGLVLGLLEGTLLFTGLVLL